MIRRIGFVMYLIDRYLRRAHVSEYHEGVGMQIPYQLAMTESQFIQDVRTMEDVGTQRLNTVTSLMVEMCPRINSGHRWQACYQCTGQNITRKIIHLRCNQAF